MVPHHDIAIVGAGFSGLATAARLKRAGFHDLVVLERAAEVGGVWRDNTYPGCACDVEAPLYSLQFALNPGWTRLFAGSAEIHAYLRGTADRLGLRPFIHFNQAVMAAVWDDVACRWQIETVAGPLTARVLVFAVGAQSAPAVPVLKGIERFQGVAFHSACWDHDHDLTGRQVAVIGTGASAVQFVPEIQPRVGQLTVYQRTPAWVVPRRDRAITAAERRWYTRAPSLMRLWRLRLFLTREFFGLAFRYPAMMRYARAAARRHLHAAVTDHKLRAMLTPDYEVGCKRILLSNDFYPALTQPNVELVANGIAEVRERSIVTADGTERPTDTIIYGTGFRVTDNPAYDVVVGRGGLRLSDALGDSPKAHLGTTLVGFPNLFILQGPNTGLGHTSVLLMVDHQISHILAAVRRMRADGLAAVEPRAAAQARYVAEVDRQMRGTVWVSGGCVSWYLDKSGRNSTLWPRSVPAFGRRVSRFRPAEYHLYRAAGEQP